MFEKIAWFTGVLSDLCKKRKKKGERQIIIPPTNVIR